jgi:tRNA-dihydrouridine synthase
MRDFLIPDRPALVLAPMQDVTDLPFMRVLARRGAPDWFVTEYFRIYPEAHLSRYILRSILENETGRPIYAQMIGRDIPSLIKSAGELARAPIAGIDLNLGCPAPIVCRKDAGGGLLRNLETLKELIGRLREAIPGRFTVKTRLGYTSVDEFHDLLEIFGSYGIDGLTIHGRTVLERYQTPVHPEYVKSAVAVMDCPVIANGNVVDISTGLTYLERTGASGLMIGRGAIRNPWIFSQFLAVFAGEQPAAPTYRNLLEYVSELYDELARETPKFNPLSHVQRMKKTLAYISHGLEGEFEYDMRRAKLPSDFHEICRSHLDHTTLLPEQPPLGSKLFCGFEALR